MDHTEYFELAYAYMRWRVRQCRPLARGEFWAYFHAITTTYQHGDSTALSSTERNTDARSILA